MKRVIGALAIVGVAELFATGFVLANVASTMGGGNALPGVAIGLAYAGMTVIGLVMVAVFWPALKPAPVAQTHHGQPDAPPRAALTAGKETVR